MTASIALQDHVALYFVASPLQLLAAAQIARTHEAGARQVLVWYKPGVGPCVRPQDWDACSYMPWPRLEPLPGAFGVHRRLLANLDLVAGLVGRCRTLHIHSAVFDTEAINHFLRVLPRRCGASTMRARILPDGLISIRRYPLSATKRGLQWLRKLRRLASPELDYSGFGGDRIGSDAPFCDRVYTLAGLPHEYPADKAVALAPLAVVADPGAARAAGTALVIGQPLVGFDLMRPDDLAAVTTEIRAWLGARGVPRVLYKGHPKDPRRELFDPSYEEVHPTEPLELWLSGQRFDCVVGVRSTSLLFAKQLYGAATPVLAFGWDRVRFKSPAERADMQRVFEACGVEIVA